MRLLPKSKSVETVSLIADSIGSSRGEAAMRLLSKSKPVETVSLIADSIGSSRGKVAMCLLLNGNLLRLSH
jgi:hypothetical protein